MQREDLREAVAATLRDRPRSPFPGSYATASDADKEFWRLEAERALDALGEIAARGVSLDRILRAHREQQELQVRRSVRRVA